MTKKQRFLTAVRGEVPDAVPVAPLLHWRFAHRLLGRHHWKDVIEAHRRVGSTFFRGPISIGPHSDFDTRWGMEGRVLERDGTMTRCERVIRTRLGSLRAEHVIGFSPDDPTLGFTTEYFVKQPEGFRIVIDYWEAELAHAGLPSHEDLDEAAQILGEEGVPSAIINSAFSRACLMRGMQGMLLDLYDAPDLVREALRVALELRRQEVRSFLASKGDVLVYDICWATGANMGPRMFRDWVFPELEQVCEMVRRAPGKYVGFYTLGRIRDLLPAMLDARPHFIETFEQNEGDITLAEAKAKYGKQVCLMGNFDPLVLQDGTLEEARREAKRCLEEGMRGGGYVLVTGDEVPPTARIENLKAMVEVAEEFGRYQRPAVAGGTGKAQGGVGE